MAMREGLGQVRDEVAVSMTTCEPDPLPPDPIPQPQGADVTVMRQIQDATITQTGSGPPPR